MRTLSFDEKHLPDVDWCLKALSALDPLHLIFDPEYVAPFNHRGRRGSRYVPTAEDLLFLDESVKYTRQTERGTRGMYHPTVGKYLHGSKSKEFDGHTPP